MCNICEWDELEEKIEWMLEDEVFEFAHDTLDGILTWVTDKQHCTEGQKHAVENIRAGGEKRRDKLQF